MRNYFHIFFAGFLLLGSLILFNRQDYEVSNRVSENPGMEHMELQAEVCSTHFASSHVPGSRHHPGLTRKSISNYLDQHADQIIVAYQLRIKKQMQVYLDLKPRIDRQSMPYIHLPSSYDEPPVS